MKYKDNTAGITAIQYDGTNATEVATFVGMHAATAVNGAGNLIVYWWMAAPIGDGWLEVTETSWVVKYAPGWFGDDTYKAPRAFSDSQFQQDFAPA